MTTRTNAEWLSALKSSHWKPVPLAARHAFPRVELIMKQGIVRRT